MSCPNSYCWLCGQSVVCSYRSSPKCDVNKLLEEFKSFWLVSFPIPPVSVASQGRTQLLVLPRSVLLRLGGLWKMILGILGPLD